MAAGENYVSWFDAPGGDDAALVGGKNAALGQMARALADVPTLPGFTLTTGAYWAFLNANELRAPIGAALGDLNKVPLDEIGRRIRSLVLRGAWPNPIAQSMRAAYRELCARVGKDNASVAVRSSATAEDLPNASFAGQLENCLNIRGEEELLDAAKKCLASLFTDSFLTVKQHVAAAEARGAPLTGDNRTSAASAAITTSLPS